MKALDEAEFTIVGTGLMGASLALALRGKVKALHGVDTNPEAREAAASCFDAVAAEFDPQARPDVIILATPVRAILQWLRALPAQIAPGTLILDLGSSKREIVALMDALPDSLLAVGGHPMCGKESSGPGEAESSLFIGRPFVLCRTAHTTTEAWDFATQIVAALDAQLVNLDAEQHDQAVAAISHLPYLVSSGLVA
ncbi:MAG TPA: prephenate dehydrogenase, partial [Aggregatilineales bacterium]|nr:prephenate dehydrogenase [Aggregatilineales bacterium]